MSYFDLGKSLKRIEGITPSMSDGVLQEFIFAHIQQYNNFVHMHGIENEIFATQMDKMLDVLEKAEEHLLGEVPQGALSETLNNLSIAQRWVFNMSRFVFVEEKSQLTKDKDMDEAFLTFWLGMFRELKSRKLLRPVGEYYAFDDSVDEMSMYFTRHGNPVTNEMVDELNELESVGVLH